MSAVFGHTIYTGSIGSSSGDDWRRLDIMEDILDQDPRATPVYEITGMTSAKDVTHFWLVRGVKSRAVNKHTEGKALFGQEISKPTRVYNICQNQMTGVEVTGISKAVQYYGGVRDIWEDQKNHYLYEHRADTEYGLIRGTRTEGDTDTANEMGGLVYSVSTNATNQGGATLDEDMFIDGITLSYDNVDAPMLDVIVGTSNRTIIDGFDSRGATRRFDVTTREVVHSVSRYYSSFGDVEIHNCRDLYNSGDTGELLYFDRRDKKKAYLRPTFLDPKAHTHDADVATIIDTMTFEWGNEKSSVLFSGLATP